eukprot:762128-Hanusia_phi.AAC.18
MYIHVRNAYSPPSPHSPSTASLSLALFSCEPAVSSVPPPSSHMLRLHPILRHVRQQARRPALDDVVRSLPPRQPPVALEEQRDPAAEGRLEERASLDSPVLLDLIHTLLLPRHPTSHPCDQRRGSAQHAPPARMRRNLTCLAVLCPGERTAVEGLEVGGQQGDELEVSAVVHRDRILVEHEMPQTAKSPESPHTFQLSPQLVPASVEGV